jgi:dihydrofolate reductase
VKTYVFSRTLRQQDYPRVTIVAEGAEQTVAALRAAPGKDIWLFGGGSLFRSLLEAGLVDTVEVAIMPVLLGGGIPLLPPPAEQTKLKLTGHKVYKTGIVLLEYTVQ